MSTPAIETSNLTKAHGTFRGISDVNLTVDEGEVYGFIGPNGAGKVHHHSHVARSHSPHVWGCEGCRSRLHDGRGADCQGCWLPAGRAELLRHDARQGVPGLRRRALRCRREGPHPGAL